MFNTIPEGAKLSSAMRYKLIALDIDGTIRGADYPISQRTHDAISRVMATGAVVTLATGRMFRAGSRFSVDLNITSPIISYQGALIGDPATGEVLLHRPLTPEMARIALDAVLPWGLHINVYLRDEVYVSEVTPWASGYAERNYSPIHVVEDLHTLAHQEPTKLLAHGDEEVIDSLTRSLSASFNNSLLITKSTSTFCEIGHPDGGKANALSWLCTRLGISREETLAFGNGLNDIDMLQWAELGIALPDSPQDVLEAADQIAPPLEEDGAAQVLEQLLSQGLVGR